MSAHPATLMPGHPAPDVALDTADGRKTRLADYWQQQPALIFFVRHLGCVFCRQQLSLLRQQYAAIRERGADVVAIVPVDAPSAARFARSLGLPFTMLADPQRHSYMAYGLAETSPFDFVQPEVLIRTARQFAQGNIPTVNPFGSSFTQLGGLCIIDTAGTIRFNHIASPVFNYPTPDIYLAALDGLRLTSDLIR